MSEKDKDGTKRKRRRRGGLRVPSDNVPRAKSQSDVAAPAPEDPRLAVSVAYAFGSNGSAATAPVEDDAIRDTIRSPSVEALADDPPESDDDFPDERTIELDSVDELLEDDDVTEAAAEVPTPLPKASSSVHDLPTRDIGLDDDGDPIDEEPEPVKQDMRSTGSVDIAFDDDDGTPERTAPNAENPLESIDEAQPETPEHSDVAVDDESVQPFDEPATGARFIRARTMALSEHDLEELMEGEVLDTDAVMAFDQRKTVRIAPLSKSDLEALEAASNGESAPDEAVDRAADVSGASSLEPSDPGDSGEIIADDMLEEIDERAKQVPLDDEASAELAESERRAEVSEPPPPPPPPKKAAVAKPKKPPPAPAVAKASVEPAARRRSKGKVKPWFEEVFDENYLRTLPFLTPQATESEANFVVESLGVESGASILDVGCGYGRHSMELAARGYNMVGLDLSLPLLLRGADEAQRRGLNINFVHGDMRDMQFEAPFDGAFCLFATFGYFDDETNKHTAQQIASALKPGAKLVLEVLNRDYLIRDLPTRVWWEGDGCVILEEVDFNYFSSRITSTRSIAFEDGRQLEQEISIRAFALHELGKLLHAAGFRVLEISGSMFTRGRFFGAQSRDIVVVAEKLKKNGASKSA